MYLIEPADPLPDLGTVTQALVLLIPAQCALAYPYDIRRLIQAQIQSAPEQIKLSPCCQFFHPAAVPRFSAVAPPGSILRSPVFAETRICIFIHICHYSRETNRCKSPENRVLQPFTQDVVISHTPEESERCLLRMSIRRSQTENLFLCRCVGLSIPAAE